MLLWRGLLPLCLVAATAAANTHDTALADAVRQNDTAEAERLLKTGKVRGERKGEALLIAIGNGNGEMSRLLLREGADPDVVGEFQNNKNTTRRALHLAASGGHADIAAALISENAEIDALDALGRTPLIIAAREGRLEVAQALLWAGARRHLRDLKGQDALSLALQRRRKEMVQLLLEHEAEVNGADPIHSRTAIHWASNTGRKELVELVLDHGAHINAADAAGKTALLIAIKRGDVDVISLLLERNAKIDAECWKAAKKQVAQVAKLVADQVERRKAAKKACKADGKAGKKAGKAKEVAPDDEAGAEPEAEKAEL